MIKIMVRKGVLTISMWLKTLLWCIIDQKLTKSLPELVYSVNPQEVISRLSYPRMVKHFRDLGQDCDEIMTELIQFGSIKGRSEIEWMIQNGYLVSCKEPH